jgi:hypothetical protein
MFMIVLNIMYSLGFWCVLKLYLWQSIHRCFVSKIDILFCEYLLLKRWSNMYRDKISTNSKIHSVTNYINCTVTLSSTWCLYMYMYIYIYINICHSRYCPSRKKEKESFLVGADDDDDVFCFLCFRLVMTNIVVDFSSFHCYAFNRSLALPLACLFLILTMPPCIYVFDTRARAMSDVACVFPFSLSLSRYIYIYICVFPRVIIYRWRWRQVNAKDGDHISFFFFSFSVVRRAYIAIACLPMCILNAN